MLYGIWYAVWQDHNGQTHADVIKSLLKWPWKTKHDYVSTAK